MVENNLSEIPVEKLSYEDALSELERIVATLESDEKALEDALNLFERGQILARHCAQLLDNAELRVRRLSGDTIENFPLNSIT